MAFELIYIYIYILYICIYYIYIERERENLKASCNHVIPVDIWEMKFRNNEKVSVTLQTFCVCFNNFTTSSDCCKILWENLQWLNHLYREGVKIWRHIEQLVLN